MIYFTILILYCEGQNLSHCWYGFSALWITSHGYMPHVFNSLVLICVLVLMVFLSLSTSLPLSLSWFKSYCTGQFAPGSSHKGRERGRETERNAGTEIPFSSSPIPLLFLHTVNTDNPGCRWWLHSATAVGWWWSELQLSVYKPVVFPRQCCCRMGFE